jgi:hypothetical protein
MDKFISEHLIRKEVEVDIGKEYTFKGRVIASADGVLTILHDNNYLFINTSQILWIKETK